MSDGDGGYDIREDDCKEESGGGDPDSTGAYDDDGVEVEMSIEELEALEGIILDDCILVDEAEIVESLADHSISIAETVIGRETHLVEMEGNVAVLIVVEFCGIEQAEAFSARL